MCQGQDASTAVWPGCTFITRKSASRLPCDIESESNPASAATAFAAIAEAEHAPISLPRPMGCATELAVADEASRVSKRPSPIGSDGSCILTPCFDT